MGPIWGYQYIEKAHNRPRFQGMIFRRYINVLYNIVYMQLKINDKKNENFCYLFKASCLLAYFRQDISTYVTYQSSKMNYSTVYIAW